MDKFKKYLQQHEAGMNVDVPASQVWEGIQQKISPRQNKVVVFARKYAVAASFLILIGAGIIIISNVGKLGKKPDDLTITKTTSKDDTTAIKRIIDSANTIGLAKTVPAAVEKKRSIKLSSKINKANSVINKPAETDIAVIGKGYTNLINYQVQKLRTTPVYAEQPGYFARFATQLKQMDTDEAGVKRDLRTYGLNDKLLEQLINVYQQKLNLLKSLQQEINKMNNRVKENESPSDTLKPYFLHL